MFSGFTKVLTVLIGVLPVIDKWLPTAKTITDATPWKWDDKVVSTVQKAVDWTKEHIGGDAAEAAAKKGLEVALKGQTLGLTQEEILKAQDDGLMLAARAKDIRKAARQQLIQGIAVPFGDRTLTTIADLKQIPDATFRLMAEADYNAKKAEGLTP